MQRGVGTILAGLVILMAGLFSDYYTRRLAATFFSPLLMPVLRLFPLIIVLIGLLVSVAGVVLAILDSTKRRT